MLTKDNIYKTTMAAGGSDKKVPTEEGMISVGQIEINGIDML
jgi:predicted methyltransferase